MAAGQNNSVVKQPEQSTDNSGINHGHQVNVHESQNISLEQNHFNKLVGKDIILNSYMRSGSSFLGQVLGSRPDAFYVFEPLWLFKNEFFKGKNTICHFFKDICEKVEGNSLQDRETTVAEAITFLHSLLNCSFYKPREFLQDPVRFPLETWTIRNGWNFCKSNSWNDYNACAEAGKPYDVCMSEIQPVCKRQKYRVLKIVRTTLDSLEGMLQERPNLIIIHLFRDPRGVFCSHITTKFLMKKFRTYSAVDADMKVHCNRMMYDISVARKLIRKYPDRFRVIQYEDFDNLVVKVDSLYKFVGMEFDDYVMNDVLKKKEKKKKNSKIGFHPFNYTRRLPWRLERIALTHCKAVYQALGYPIFENEQEYVSFLDTNPSIQLPYAL